MSCSGVTTATCWAATCGARWAGPRPARASRVVVRCNGSRRRVGKQLYRTSARLLPGKLRVRAPGEKIQKFVDLVGAQDMDALYLGLTSLWRAPEALVVGSAEAPAPRIPALAHPLDRMMLADLTRYLPGDGLVKVDRASMGVSLEARVPLLDHRVVEFAWRLPAELQDPARHRQVVSAASARSVRSQSVVRTTEGRFLGAARRMAAWGSAGLGRRAPRREPSARRRLPASDTSARRVARSSLRAAQRRGAVVGRAVVSGVARRGTPFVEPGPDPSGMTTDQAPRRVLRIISRTNVGGPALQVSALSRGLDPARYEQRMLVGSVGPDEADYLDLRAPGIPFVRIAGLGRAPGRSTTSAHSERSSGRSTSSSPTSCTPTPRRRGYSVGWPRPGDECPQWCTPTTDMSCADTSRRR